MYAYVGNNPLSYTDPSGESWWSTLLGIGLDIAGFFTGGTTTILGSILTTGGTVLTGGSIGGGIIGGISGGVNSGPWNEQWPIGGGFGGGLNTGDVFGSGNTGPFVNNIIDVDPSSPTYKFYVDAIEYLTRDPGMAGIIQRLQASKTHYRITMRSGVQGVGGFNRGDNEILWDPHASATITGGCVSPAFVLGHELAHAEGWDSGKVSYFFRTMWPAGAYGNREEQRVITGPEAAAARTLGEPTRQNHIANPAYSPNSTSRTCQ